MPTKKELQGQREIKFNKRIKFSIVVSLYNTQQDFLEDMIKSVIEQTYSCWELCLADGSDDDHDYVRYCCERYAKLDSRILYKKLEENLGIAENTNKALKMATGEYIGLLDHDDMLHPSALFECMKVIDEKSADMIYTDEMIFKNKLDNVRSIHFKPDFSPDTLRGYNYICHFCIYSSRLKKEVGYFSSSYDGSQDYDMILRLTEKAENIVHISKVLYFWRSHDLSVAGGIEAKPYCLEAAKKALSEHLKRLGMNALVKDSK